MRLIAPWWSLVLLCLTACSTRDPEPIGNRARALIQTGDLSFPVLETAFADTALGGAEWVEIGDRVVVEQAGQISNSGSGTLRVGTDAVVGSLWARGAVELRDRSTVQGQIRSETTVVVAPTAAVTSGTSTGSVGHSLGLVSPGEDFDASLGDVRLEPNEIRSLAPGAYGVLAIKQNSVVRLESGSYFFEEVIGDSGSTIELDSLCAPVTIRVRDQFLFRSRIEETSGTGGAGLAVFYSGSTTAHVEAAFRGSIVAPNSELVLNAQTHEGRFFARRLRVQAGARIVPKLVSLPAITCGTETLTPSSPECSDGLCCAEDGIKATLNACQPAATTANCVHGTSGSDFLQAAPWKASSSGHFVALLNEGADLVDARGRLSTVAGGGGDDVICGSANGSYLVGGPGNDVLRSSGSGKAVLYPGAGRDRLLLGSGDDIVVVADLCEITSGEVWSDTGGKNYVYSPFSRAQLEAAGLAVNGSFVFTTVRGLGCHATCGGQRGCPLTDACGADDSGEVCVPGAWDSSLEVGDWGRGPDAFAGVPEEIRQLLFRFLDSRTASASEREAALSALRARREEVVRAVAAELAKLDEANAFSWHDVQVTILSAVGGNAAATLLRDLVLAPEPNFTDDGSHHETPRQRHGEVRRRAVAGIARMAHAGLPVAEKALDEILAHAGPGSGLDEAVVQYRTLGDDPARRERLRSLLPESQRYLMDFTLYDLANEEGPQVPAEVRGTP